MKKTIIVLALVVAGLVAQAQSKSTVLVKTGQWKLTQTVTPELTYLALIFRNAKYTAIDVRVALIFDDAEDLREFISLKDMVIDGDWDYSTRHSCGASWYNQYGWAGIMTDAGAYNLFSKGHFKKIEEALVKL